MKKDEELLLIAVYRLHGTYMNVRDIIRALEINPKRAHYLLEKWAGKGWYDYGVATDLGWLTNLGKEKGKEAQEAYQQTKKPKEPNHE